jgi:hypothetical protein
MAGITNRTMRALVESGINPETGNPFATEEEQAEWNKKLNEPPSKKKKKGWLRRILGLKKGGPVKKYAKGGGVRKARYK